MLGCDRDLAVEAGDLLAVLSAAAALQWKEYGEGNEQRRGARAAEVAGQRRAPAPRLIRRRETVEDQLRTEQALDGEVVSTAAGARLAGDAATFAASSNARQPSSTAMMAA